MIGRRWGETPESGRGLGVRHSTDADNTPQLLSRFAQDQPGLGMTPPCPGQFLVMPPSSSLFQYGAFQIPSKCTLGCPWHHPPRDRAAAACEPPSAASAGPQPRGRPDGALKARLRHPGPRGPRAALPRRARRRAWAGRSLGGVEPGRRESRCRAAALREARGAEGGSGAGRAQTLGPSDPRTTWCVPRDGGAGPLPRAAPARHPEPPPRRPKGGGSQAVLSL